MALQDTFDNVRASFNALSPREKQLVTTMGGLFALLIVIVPMWLVASSVRSLESENSEIQSVLHRISAERGRLMDEQAQRDAERRLFDNAAPALGGFLEQLAKRHGLDDLEVTDQPVLDLDGVSRRSVRATLRRVELLPLIQLFSDIENSGHPVSLSMIEISGAPPQTPVNSTFTVNAYDRGVVAEPDSKTSAHVE